MSAAATPCRACLRATLQHGARPRVPRHFPRSLASNRALHLATPPPTPSHRTRSATRALSTTPYLLAPASPANVQNAAFIRDACQALFKECARQADYIVPQAFTTKAEIPMTESGEHIGEGHGWWYESLHFTPTFNTWAQITCLHMWLLTTRLRMFPPETCNQWLQQLLDAFFYEAEHRMTIFHQMSSRMIRNRSLKDLHNQWRGAQAAYDEGLIKGDAVLAAAVWRNVFAAKDDADWRDVALVVSFMRRGLRGLEKAGDEQIAGAMIRFGSPISERAIVELPSVGMAKAFGEIDVAEADQLADEIKKLK